MFDTPDQKSKTARFVLTPESAWVIVDRIPSPKVTPSAMPSTTGEQTSQQDRIVAVMGLTGAGKSKFIEHATGQGGENVAHSWKSSKAGIQYVRVKHPTDGYPVVFVDTPGLDHTYQSDAEILTTIADWLTKTYKDNLNLATVLYLHRISDNRMSGTAIKSLRLFSGLCGQKTMPNVVIVTTMWTLVPDEWGTKREEVLKAEVWHDMLRDGCKTERFKDTYESAWDIVRSVLQKDSSVAPFDREKIDKIIQETRNETKRTQKLRKSLLGQIRSTLSQWFGWK